MHRGRAVPTSRDHETLAGLGFKNDQQIVISKVLGQKAEDPEGMEEKNKQFVGDLLFGHTSSQNPDGGANGSVVDSYRINHGYRILGQTLETLVKGSVCRAWRAEQDARRHEMDLLAR